MGDRFTEPFSRSYPIRQEQHQQMHRFLWKHLTDAAEAQHTVFEADFSSPRAYHASMAPQRERFMAHVGLGMPLSDSDGPPAVPDVRIEEIGRDDVATFSRVWVRVASDLDLYGLYMSPRSGGSRRGVDALPLIVAQHGGGGCPEAVCGLDERAAYDDIGRKAAIRGYAVFAPFILMTVTYGGDPTPPRDRYSFDQMARLVNRTIVGIEIYRIIEGVKALAAAVDEVDPSRICMAGLSYGGFFSLYTSAASEIFACAVVSGILSSRLEDGARGNFRRGLDRLLPGAAESFETTTVARLVCPRPLMVQHGITDTVVPVDAARAVSRQIVPVYERLGIPERYTYHEHAGGHEFASSDILDFVDRHIR
jgi:dipeptidyl aminopeptidase/acylaminoacyl peptidase